MTVGHPYPLSKIVGKDRQHSACADSLLVRIPESQCTNYPHSGYSVAGVLTHVEKVKVQGA
jgi:hypothetical protein